MQHLKAAVYFSAGIGDGRNAGRCADQTGGDSEIEVDLPVAIDHSFVF
jgi:hypothetical protein